MDRLVRVGVGAALACAIAFSPSVTIADEPQKAAATFEDLLNQAQPISDLKELLAPLFNDCKSDDEYEARQCASIRDWTIEQNKQKTFSAIGDESALAFNPYDSAEKKLEMEISGCLACGRPLQFDDKPRFVTTRVPKAIRAGRAVGLEVGFDEVSLKDEKAASEFEKKTGPRLRVQFIFKLGQVWKSGTFEGVTFTPIAHRVFDKCNGKVVASEPPSTESAQPMPDASCPVEISAEEKRQREWAALPDQLTTIQINQGMAAARPKVHDCYAEFEVAGTAIVKMVVTGDGKIENMVIQPPFDKTPTGYCIKNALRSITLPRFKGEKMMITYPFTLQ